MLACSRRWSMPRDTARTSTDLPNTLTIAGTGVPVTYEVTVDGAIEMDAHDPVEEATIVSGSAVEGAIDRGVKRFWFEGDLADVTVDGRVASDFSAIDDADLEVEYASTGR